MNKRKRILFLFILAGLMILNYPFVSQWLNRRNESKVIRTYEESVEQADQEKLDKMYKEAVQYNQSIAEKQQKLSDAFSSDSSSDEVYQNVLNPGNDGIMGYLEIPDIDVTLPVYHGTEAAVLENGAGHLYGSSLPVGGTDTHAVLSSHRGLPDKTLFTDLDQLDKGDLFFIRVLGKKLAYKVDRIETVTPEETDSLSVVPGKDYVTLVTCTPYGINSHRLLVRGVRTEVPEETGEGGDTGASKAVGFWKILQIFAGLSVICILISGKILLFPGNKNKKSIAGR